LDKLVNLVTLNGEDYKQPDKLDLIIDKMDSLFKRIENLEQNIAEIKRQIRQCLDKLINLKLLNGEDYKQPDKRDLILNKIDSLFKRIENVEQNIAEIKRQIRQ
jgi:uncharacterized protein (UPF0335 family)